MTRMTHSKHTKSYLKYRSLQKRSDIVFCIHFSVELIHDKKPSGKDSTAII